MKYFEFLLSLCPMPVTFSKYVCEPTNNRYKRSPLTLQNVRPADYAIDLNQRNLATS